MCINTQLYIKIVFMNAMLLLMQYCLLLVPIRIYSLYLYARVIRYVYDYYYCCCVVRMTTVLIMGWTPVQHCWARRHGSFSAFFIL